MIPSTNPDVNSGLVAIMMCQCRFVHYNKHSAQRGGIDGGGVVYVHCGKSLYFYSAVTLELLFKKKQPIKNEI